MADYGFHKMNEAGQERSKRIAKLFEDLTKELELHFYDSRTASLCRTKLEEACFYAKKSMALNTDNQADA